MSVFLSDDLADLGSLLESAECFKCGGRVTGQPFVMWAGYPGRCIVMHPDCARSIGCHLIQDAREADIASGTRQWTSRGMRAVRAGLLVQEQMAGAA